ncbi:hypothetical protein [Salarchaeum sp. JOR-1]|uniref:DUF7718 family protein n=1 Tax=Salarchaeum sp. JOR-1 TaxID=2599399 RepID=UPI0011984CA3|nr:hypothetical protein [Salarchaeum sp. JOR-1]QDX41774.1 hypothetical protein FQU85_12985 [Salarchaeum sp. JOR-1]
MSDYEFSYHYSVARLRGKQYQIGVRADPSINDVETFAVLLFYERSDGTVITIAKIDNTEHREGKIHLDQYYRTDPRKKDFDIPVTDVFDAADYLGENVERFARLYADHHGDEKVD